MPARQAPPTRRRVAPAGVLALLVGLAASCRAPAHAESDEVARLAAEHRRRLAEWEAARAALAATEPAPATHDLGRDGTVILRELRLAGPLDGEQLLAHLTWVNTTGRTVDAVRVRLTVLDPSTGEDSWQELWFELPPPFRLTPGSSYTDHLRVDTGGLHLRPGWTWELEVEVDPTEPPDPSTRSSPASPRVAGA